ncbi:transposase [Paenibacillus sp.]|uniref:transposase n=1 Tax=Paenibacillus sp. TaxID=58172 RepID=UPI0035CD0E7A
MHDIICPNNELLTYELTNRDGYRMYLSNAEKCRNCPLLGQCTHHSQKKTNSFVSNETQEFVCNLSCRELSR